MQPTKVDRAQGASIQIDKLERAFEGTGPVVASLNLTIASGDFVALLGPSGCGKSTLLRLMAGLDRPDHGSIRIDSHGREFFRAFVFQESALLPWATVFDNVMLPLQLMKRDPKEAKAMARATLERVGLQDALHRYPSQLSGGMKMRTSVARALVVEPSLLLLDEPFAALDENTRHRLQDELRALWEKLRMTTVFVTHSVSEATYLANRAIVFSRRPATLLRDRMIELPPERKFSLRTDPRFIREMEFIYSAFDTGVAT